MLCKTIFILLTLCTCFTIGAAQPTVAVTHESNVKPHQGIDKIYQRFYLAYEKLDAEMVAELYTEDAFYLVPDQNIKRGRVAILKNFATFFDYNKQAGRTLSITFQIVGRRVENSLGYDVGIYTLRSFKDRKQLAQDQGKFVVVTTKQKNGSWKFALDGYSGLEAPVQK